jgi:hypothetical protein
MSVCISLSGYASMYPTHTYSYIHICTLICFCINTPHIYSLCILCNMWIHSKCTIFLCFLGHVFSLTELNTFLYVNSERNCFKSQPITDLVIDHFKNLIFSKWNTQFKFEGVKIYFDINTSTTVFSLSTFLKNISLFL